MNPETKKTSEAYGLFLNLAYKINFNMINILLYEILPCTAHGKI